MTRRTFLWLHHNQKWKKLPLPDSGYWLVDDERLQTSTDEEMARPEEGAAIGNDETEPFRSGPPPSQGWRVAWVRLALGSQLQTLLLKPASQRVWLNGEPLLTDARVIRSRDEILIDLAEPSDRGDGDAGLEKSDHSNGSLRLFFDDESLAQVEAFIPSDDESADCPRCQQPILEGCSSVRCPSCGVACHETRSLNCWTYTSDCPTCGANTDLSGDPWSPMQIWGEHG